MKKYLIFIIILCSNLIFAQLDRSKMPAAGPAPEIKIPDYESFVLDNGLTVFVIENNKVPKISFSLIINRDPVFEGEKAGFISITGDLLRTGTKTRTKEQLDKEIDFIGASLSTSYNSISASAVSRHKEKLMELMSDIILNAVFRQNELDKIIMQTKSGLAAAKEDPNSIANNVRKAAVYGTEHPYGEIITEESVNRIKIEDCKNYYETFFSPGAAYLAVVGNISKKEAETLVKKYLSKWTKKQIPNFGYKSPSLPKTNTVCLVDRPASVQSVINVSYPVNLKPDSKDVIPASLMNAVLGGSFNARLMQNLREDKGYTYGIRSSLNPDKLTGFFNSSCEVRNKVTDSAIVQILHEMKKLRTKEVPANELQSMKNYITGSFARQLERPETIARFAINSAIYNLPEDYYREYLKNLQDVEPETIKEMANKYLHPENAYIVVVGKADDILNDLKRLNSSENIVYYDAEGNKFDPSMKKIPAGLTGSDVVEKYLRGIGGRGKISSIKDMTSIYQTTANGLEIKLTVIQKNPNKIYQEIDANIFKQKTIFDGKNGARLNGDVKTSISASEIELIKFNSTYSNWLNLSKLGVKTKITGIEQIKGKDCYKVDFSLKDGTSFSAYFDKETGLMTKQTTPLVTEQGSFTTELYFDNYDEVKGIKLPKTIKQVIAGQSFTFNLVSREINKGVKDSVFEID